MQEILQYFFSGITTGAVYAVIALGFTLLFNATGLINFAQGEFVMLGALILISLWKVLELPLIVAFALAVSLVALMGVVMERLALRTVRKPHPIVMVIITIGVSILLRGVGMLTWGKDAHSVEPFTRHAPLELHGATLLPQSLWILGIVLIVVVGLQFFFKRTLMGKAMEACAISKKAAWLLGIPSEKMVLAAFAMSAAMGGVAGVLIAPITMSSYDMGTMLGLKGFCAAMLGGLGSVLGAVLGGLLLGVIESFGVGLVASGLKDVLAFVILLFILYARPSGLLGSKTIQRF